MRQRYIVTYDICNPARLRKVFKVLKGFGLHLQLSVFRCDLTATTLAMLKAQVQSVIHTREDQVLIIDIGPADGRGAEVIDSLGRPYFDGGRSPNVV